MVLSFLTNAITNSDKSSKLKSLELKKIELY